MTVYRTFDPSVINRIANIPKVRATLGAHMPGGTLDFTECANRPSDYIILVSGADAVSLFEYKHPRVLDGHSVFDLTCRGRDAIRIGRQMIDWLFHNTDALIITGGTPSSFKAARWFNRQIGMKSDGLKELDGVHWQTRFEYFHLLRSDWEQRQSSE